MPHNEELLAILACPVCRNQVHLTDSTEGLLCRNCSLVYPIREEIPVMLPEEAVPAADWDGGKREAAPERP